MSAHAPHLLIDAGNSRIKWALVDPSSPRPPLAVGAFAHAWAPAHTAPGASELPSQPDWSSLPTPGGAWISNVAGADSGARIDALLTARWPHLARRVLVSQPRQCGVVNRYRDPGQLGSDRWAALIGARAAYPGETVLIATFGTATTIEALHADGVFAGGLIAPGWSLMMHSLGRHAAQLPELTVDARADAARALSDGRHAGEIAHHSVWPFATQTAESMIEGCRLAQAGLVEKAWRALCAELGTPVRCVIGGGDAQQVAPALTIPYTRHEQLVLAGLAVIANADTAVENGGARTGPANEQETGTAHCKGEKKCGAR